MQQSLWHNLPVQFLQFQHDSGSSKNVWLSQWASSCSPSGQDLQGEDSWLFPQWKSSHHTFRVGVYNSTVPFASWLLISSRLKTVAIFHFKRNFNSSILFHFRNKLQSIYLMPYQRYRQITAYARPILAVERTERRPAVPTCPAVYLSCCRRYMRALLSSTLQPEGHSESSHVDIQNGSDAKTLPISVRIRLNPCLGTRALWRGFSWYESASETHQLAAARPVKHGFVD